MLFCLVLLSAVIGGGGQTPGPRIESGHGTCRLVMPKAMWAALERHAPGFTPFRFEQYAPHLFRRGPGWHYEVTERQAPFAVVGDFNGDKIKDVVVNGCTRRSCGPVAVLSQGKRFVASDVAPGAEQAPEYPRPGDYPLEDVLRLVPPSVVHSPHLEPKPLVLKTDAVEEIYFEKAAAIYYFTGDRYFATYATSD